MKRWMQAALLATVLGTTAAPAHAAGGGRWADKIIIDPMAASLMLVYFDNNVPSAERMSFGAIDTVEYVPTYEGRVEEVVLAMANGSRVLVSMGQGANQDALMIAAVLGQRPQPQTPDTERIVPSGISSGGPQLVMGAVDNTTVMDPLSMRYAADTLLGDIDASAEDIVQEEVVYDEPPGFITATDNRGELERNAIELGIQSKMPTFKNCYQRQLQRTPNLPSGGVTIQFVIDADGVVDRARVAKTTLRNADVEGCLVQNLEGTQFPIPRNDGTVVVSYPFLFKRR